MEKQNFYDLNFDQLKSFLIEKGEVEPKKAKMRSQQLFNAVYKKNIKSFDELTTFGAELRGKIKDLISLKKPKIIDVQKSKDGTIKFLLELKDKRNVETVLIPDKSQSRYTICLSVSVGCYLSCEFCATAQISKKLVRNLSLLLVVKVDWAIQDSKVLLIGLQGNLQKELKEKSLQFGFN